MSKTYMIDITENISDIQIKNLKTLKENAPYILIPESVMEDIINDQSNRFLEPPNITEEEIAIIKNYVFNNSKLKKWTKIDEISDEYIKNLYKINMWSTVIRVLQNEHIHNIDQKKLNKYYSIFVKEFTKILSIELSKYNIPTPLFLYKAINKKEKGKYSELETSESKTFFRDIILNDELLSKEEKQNLIQGNNPNYVIDKWLGIKLKKNEKRLLRALRRVAHRLIVGGNCSGDIFTYCIKNVPLSEIYEEYGLKPISNNGYDYKQTKPIQDILLNSSLIKKDILIKNNNRIVKTSFITSISINSIPTKKGNQNISVDFTISKVLFINNEMGIYNYYNQDHLAYKRFMEVEGVARNDLALDLFEYLESKIETVKSLFLDFTTIIKELNIEKNHAKNPKRVRENINKILKIMVEKNCLIKNWRIEKGKHNQDKYIFEPIIVNYSTKTKNYVKMLKNKKQNKLRV